MASLTLFLLKLCMVVREEAVLTMREEYLPSICGLETVGVSSECDVTFLSILLAVWMRLMNE